MAEAHESSAAAAAVPAQADSAVGDDDTAASTDDAPKPNRKVRRMQRLGLSYPEPAAASAPAKSKTKAQQSKQKPQRQKPAPVTRPDHTAPTDAAVQFVPAAAPAEAASSAVPADAAQSVAPEFSLLSLVQQLAQYGPGPADPAASNAAPGAPLPTPPFDLFVSVVAHVRAEIQKGETHLSVPAESPPLPPQNPQEPQQQEDGTVRMADADGASSAASSAAVSTSLDLRSLLHRTRIHFARCYPLPSASWLEWIDDVQSLGSGSVEPAAEAPVVDEDAEAAEARQDAEAAQEQLFLVSLFRMALTDYASPQLWDAFLSYVARAIDSVLKTPRAVTEFRAMTRAAIYPRGVLEEQRIRAAEKKAAARAKKEAAASSSGAASASRKGSAQAKAQKKQPESKEDDDGMEDDHAAEDDSSSDEDENDSDESDDDEWSEAEEELVAQDAQQSVPSVFAPGRIHAAFLPLLSGPLAAADPRALPAPIAVGYSFVDGDALFQKLRAIETTLLTRMMQQMKRQQEEASSVDPSDIVHEADLMSQMDRLSRLYRVELGIPLRPADLDASFEAFEDWQRKAGNDSEPEVREAYEYQSKVAKTLEKKFEASWAALSDAGQVSSGVGTVTPAVADLFRSYLSFLSDNSKARKRCKSNPSQLFSVCERIIAVGFLDATWWGTYLDLAEQFVGRNAESLLSLLEFARRALRNCPWDARIFAGFIHALEALLEADASMDLAAVESEIESALAKQSSVARLEVLVESRLEVIGFYRRVVLSKAQGGVPLKDVQRIRSAFETLASMLPGLPGFLSSAECISLVSRVYRIWVELECSYLIHTTSDSLDEEAQGWHDDAQASVEVVARKAGVSVRTYRARQLFQQYIDGFGAEAQAWLDWTTFEIQSLATCTDAHEVESLLSFIRSLFRQAVDRMTSAPGFDVAGYSSLQALAPVLRSWLEFELVHAGSLPHLQSAQRRCAKYLEAFKPLQAQATQNQYAQNWNAAAATADSTQDDQAPVAWFNKPAGNKKGAGKSAAKPKGKRKGASAVAPPAAAAASVTVDAPAAPAAGAAAGAKKKRKRDEDKEGSDGADGSAPVSDENAAKKSHTGEAAASAPSATASSAPAASALPDTAPHTAFVLHLPWTLREPELRALFTPFGPIVRLAAHRAATKPTAPRHPAYVEVQFESEEAAQSIQTGLEGKEMYGKKIGVARSRPSDDTPPASLPAASSAAASTVSFDETDPLSVFVKNLPRDVADLPQLVRAHFQDCGEIKSIEIPQHGNTAAGAAAAANGSSWRNFGSIYFTTAEGATAALAKNLSTLGSTVIGVVPNQAPARRKLQANKIAVEKKRHPTPASARLQFVPRAMAATASKQHEPAAAAAPTEVASAAVPATVNSNSDFRAMLLASKRA